MVTHLSNILFDEILMGDVKSDLIGVMARRLTWAISSTMDMIIVILSA